MRLSGPPLMVLQSDDWGAVRIASRQARNALNRRGFLANRRPREWFDALEGEDDLSALQGVLAGVELRHGRRPTFTANVTVANPDFAAIRRTGFSRLVLESLDDTLQRARGHGAWRTWQQLIAEGWVTPEFQGRDAVHPDRWLADLRFGIDPARASFDLDSIGPASLRFSDSYYHASYDYAASRSPRVAEAISDGVLRFARLFGRQPSAFAAPRGVWGDAAERALSLVGIRCTQGPSVQKVPLGDFNGEPRYRRRLRFSGRRSQAGVQLVRNVRFEPVLGGPDTELAKALAAVAESFSRGLPAVVGISRMNLVGVLEESNREAGLLALRQFLDAVCTRWPSMRFAGTAELLAAYESQS